jgi:serine phosphatase RsbU (regulator of sigma subunit)
MTGLHLMIPEHGAFALGEDRPILTLGRASANHVVLTDPSLSRFHARLRWESGSALLEDLGSRNGTLLNGHRIVGRRPLAPGDEITLGRVSFRVEAVQPLPPPVPEDSEDDSGSSLSMSLEKLRQFRGPGDDAQEAMRLRRALHLIHAFSLELMREAPLETLLEQLLAKLSHLLRPHRSAILLRDGKGALVQALARSAHKKALGPLNLSRTMVEAALERREAMLVNDPKLDPRLAKSDSLIRSGVTSLMTVPMEHEGEVVGLVYLDADPSRAPFTPEDLQVVASLAHLAAARIQQSKVSETLRRGKVLEHELALARQIQERLLPDRAPSVEGFELFGHNQACHAVSGDLFGFFPRQDGRLWVVLADVAGKGMGAGLLMASFQAYLWAWAEATEDPAVLAGRISAELARRTTANRYVTAFIALLDPVGGHARCTSAGHNPIPVFRAAGRRDVIESMGFPLALFPGTPYRCEDVALEPGDLMFLYTDGITEAESPEGQEFGLEGAAHVFCAHPGLPLEALHQHLETALEAHTQGASLADDRTLILLRRA